MANTGVPAHATMFFSAGQTQSVSAPGSATIAWPNYSTSDSSLVNKDSSVSGGLSFPSLDRGGIFLLGVNLVVQHTMVASRVEVTYTSGFTHKISNYVSTAAQDFLFAFTGLVIVPPGGRFSMGISTAAGSGTLTIQARSSMYLFRLSGEDVGMPDEDDPEVFAIPRKIPILLEEDD